MGTPEQAEQRIAEFAAAGVQRIMLQDFLPRDLEMVTLLGRIARRLTPRRSSRGRLRYTPPLQSPGQCRAGAGDRDEHVDRALPEAARAPRGAPQTEEPMPDNTVVVAAAAALIVGIALGYLSRRFLAASSVKHAEGYAERLMAEARAKQKEIVLEGKDDALKVQRAAEEEAREKRADLQRQERLLLDRAGVPGPQGRIRLSGARSRSRSGSATWMQRRRAWPSSSSSSWSSSSA